MNQLLSAPLAYRWIASDTELSDLVEKCQRSKWVALDTEFVRTNTYYPQIGLIQLALDSEFFLIDPLAIKNKALFGSLLSDPGVVKVMHACSEDLEVFQRYLGLLPEPLFDTQIAAAILGHGMSVGYKTLVAEMYQVNLPKEEQRSNWLKRPLSQPQKDYAVLDVIYLADIYRQQLKTLEELDRLSWVDQECQNLLAKQREQIAPEQLYRRIKGAGTLTGEQLAVLQALAIWREKEVERRDIPRGFLLKDLVMVELARRQPESLAALAEVEPIHPRVLRKD
ncbi:MAG: ribonuclease D, partial [Pseudomonadales bacterium]|nr:ribonuclease D [Pseudomonadales bacterium]